MHKIKQGYKRDDVVWGLRAKVEVLTKPRLARKKKCDKLSLFWLESEKGLI
jgi:hypothetical protein